MIVLLQVCMSAFLFNLVCWDPPTEEGPTMSKKQKGKQNVSVTATATKLVPDNGAVAVRQHSPSTTYLRAGQPWPYCKPSICVCLFVFVFVCLRIPCQRYTTHHNEAELSWRGVYSAVVSLLSPLFTLRTGLHQSCRVIEAKPAQINQSQIMYQLPRAAPALFHTFERGQID